MKLDFTQQEIDLIESIASLYNIRTLVKTKSVYKGAVLEDRRISLNGKRFLDLLNTTNIVYIGMDRGMLCLTIISQ